MIRRRDHHRIHVRCLEQPPVILVLLRRTAGLLRRKIHVSLRQIANGGHLRVRLLEKSIEYLVATVAYANKPQAYAIIRIRRLRAPHSSSRPGQH
jgi:hypothetical protein